MRIPMIILLTLVVAFTAPWASAQTNDGAKAAEGLRLCQKHLDELLANCPKKGPEDCPLAYVCPVDSKDCTVCQALRKSNAPRARTPYVQRGAHHRHRQPRPAFDIRRPRRSSSASRGRRLGRPNGLSRFGTPSSGVHPDWSGCPGSVQNGPTAAAAASRCAPKGCESVPNREKRVS